MNDDIVQFDYLPEEKIVKINLPEEVLKSIDTIIITKHFKDEIIISRKENINETDDNGLPVGGRSGALCIDDENICDF